MLDRWPVLVPALLCAQAVLVHWAASGERPPAPPDLAGFPVQFADWKMLHEDPLDDEIVNKLHADELVSRTYAPVAGGEPAGLFIAWFRSQRGGERQPHSPQVCLPGSGWTPESTGEITLATSQGPITINRYIVASRHDRAVVLYWYQTPRRVIAGEWAAKFWLLPDAIRDRRTDTTQVRIEVWSTHTGDDAATVTASNFARSLYPVLRERLP